MTGVGVEITASSFCLCLLLHPNQCAPHSRSVEVSFPGINEGEEVSKCLCARKTKGFEQELNSLHGDICSVVFTFYSHAHLFLHLCKNYNFVPVNMQLSIS